MRPVTAATWSPKHCGRWKFPYIAVTPGASYRGLHDSIVNYLGNTMPQMFALRA